MDIDGQISPQPLGLAQMWLNTSWNLILFRFIMGKISGQVKDDLENFEMPQHPQKIDTPYFAFFKTIQLLLLHIFSLDA